MQIFTDNNISNLISLYLLACERISEYWKFKTIAYEIQNKSLLIFYEAVALLIESISMQNKNKIVQ